MMQGGHIKGRLKSVLTLFTVVKMAVKPMQIYIYH